MHPSYAKTGLDLSMIVSPWCNCLRLIKLPITTKNINPNSDCTPRTVDTALGVSRPSSRALIFHLCQYCPALTNDLPSRLKHGKHKASDNKREMRAPVSFFATHLDTSVMFHLSFWCQCIRLERVLDWCYYYSPRQLEFTRHCICDLPANTLRPCLDVLQKKIAMKSC